jgi:hypothetical protein
LPTIKILPQRPPGRALGAGAPKALSCQLALKVTLDRQTIVMVGFRPP